LVRGARFLSPFVCVLWRMISTLLYVSGQEGISFLQHAVITLLCLRDSQSTLGNIWPVIVPLSHNGTRANLSSTSHEVRL